MADVTSRKIIEYKADIRDVRKKLADLYRVQRQLAKNATDQLAGGYKKAGDQLDKFGRTTNIKKVDGELKRLTSTTSKTTQTLKRADGQLVKVTTTTKRMANGTKVVSKSFQDVNRNTVSLGENIARLGKRALITIPVWLVLRTTMMGVFRTIRDGLKTIADQDRAFQKARRNLQGTSEEIAKNFATLQKEVRKLSLETGESVEKITNAFQKFATVGFDFQTSMEGATSATKLAILLFGDVEETANAFARTMRVLVDRSIDAESAGHQITQAMAQTAELWKTNAFELNEFTESMEKFAPTAKTMNLSAQQTISLLSALSTAGLRSGRAGRLLRTAFTKVITQTDKLAKSLGVKVNPNLDTTFDVFIKTLDALEKTRNETGKVSPAFEKLVKSISGLRSADAIKGLIALRKELRANLAITGDIAQFNKEFEDVNSQIFKLVEQFHNANREIGRAFVVGITGAEDFREGLEKIVETLKSIIDNALVAGDIIRKIAISTLGPSAIWIEYNKRIEKSAKLTDSLLEKITKGIRGKLIAKDLANLITVLAETEDIEPGLKENALKVLTKKFSEEMNLIKKLTSSAINEGLEEADLKFLKKKLEQVTPDLLGITQQQFDLIVKGIDRTLEEIASKVKEAEEKKLKIPVGVDIELTDLQTANQIIVDNAITQLKAEGALESQLIKRRSQLEKLFNIYVNSNTELKRQLELEQKLRKEKRLQADLSNESLKLFRIAQKYGTDIAKQIGDVLSGQVDFASFIRRGGEAVDIFKKDFANVFETEQAKQFFKGLTISGLGRLRGGVGISIKEQAELRGVGGISGILADRERLLKRYFPAGQVPVPTVSQINPTINNVYNIRSTDPKGVVREIELKQTKDANNPESQFYKNVSKVSLNI